MNLREINSRTWCKDYKSLVRWNDQQINIIDEIKSSSNNLSVIARAGCGKTSILAGIVGALGNKTTGNILAFNAHIADYLKTDKRIPNNRIKVSTAHSYGLSMLKKLIDEPRIQKSKYTNLFDSLLDSDNVNVENFIKGTLGLKRSVAKDIMYGMHKLLFLCRSWLIDIKDVNQILELYDYYGYEFPITTEHLSLLCDYLSKALIKGKDTALNKSIIDFGDMIWLPNELDLQNNTHKDIVLMDEAQDANLAMIGVLNKLIGPSTRAVFMCDDRQEIYGFNGSVPGICNQINERFNTKVMPLTYCYRCPESHLELVRKWVPDIICGKENQEGVIHQVTHKEMDRQYKPGMVVVGRFNAPLVNLGIRLIIKGTSVYMPHKDITQSFISLLDTVRSLNVNEAYNVLEERMDIELSRAQNSKGKTQRKLKNISDRFGGTLHIIERLKSSKSSISQMISFLEELQQKPPGESVHITTIHSYKGGEANTIVLLDNNQMPYYGLCTTDWEEHMEENVAYVAHTRSKETLYLVNSRK